MARQHSFFYLLKFTSVLYDTSSKCEVRIYYEDDKTCEGTTLVALQIFMTQII